MVRLPGPRTRDWLANLAAEPRFTFHLKHGIVADLPAVATVVNDPRHSPLARVNFVADPD